MRQGCAILGLPCLHGALLLNFSSSPWFHCPQNMDNIVNDSDNVKQDMSIDVYGRKKAEDYKAKQVQRARAVTGCCRALVTLQPL